MGRCLNSFVIIICDSSFVFKQPVDRDSTCLMYSCIKFLERLNIQEVSSCIEEAWREAEIG